MSDEPLTYENGYDATKPQRPLARGPRGAVSTGHMLATLTGLDVLRRGGNAVDAGVAAGAVINVVHCDMTSMAGVAPIIVYLADEGRVVTISGVGRWPRAASLEWFWQHNGGRFGPGIQHCVTPAALDAWATALAHFGTSSLGDVLEPAIRLAEEGFPVHGLLAHHLKKYWRSHRAHPASEAIVAPGGRLLEEGDTMRLPELATTLRAVVAGESAAIGSREDRIRAGRDVFYKGAIAERYVSFSRDNGGFFETDDFASFAVDVEPSLSLSFRGFEVHSCGPWCQGPVLLQALAILDHTDVGDVDHNSARYVHLVTEALNLAMADREQYYGDPVFVAVPMAELLAPRYAELRAGLIRPGSASTAMAPPGDPYRPAAILDGHRWRFTETWDPASVGGEHLVRPELDTSYVSVVDEMGNLFSATPSGSFMTPLASPVVPGIGLPLSSRGSQSRLDPAHPAAVRPRSRPRMTPSPGMITRDGRPVAAFGSPGGDVQPQAMLQVVLNVVLFGMDWQTAVEAPRFATYNFPDSFYPHRYQPGVIRVESRLSDAVLDELRTYGYRVEVWPPRAFEAGSVCVAGVFADSGMRLGAADVRREALALAW